MKNLPFFSIFLFTVFLFGAKGVNNPPAQTIFLFKDKDGLYEYNPATKKEQLVFKATDKQVFLNEPAQLSGDTLTFGFAGGHTYSDSAHYSGMEKYEKEYFSVNLVTGKSWPSKKVLYEIPDQKTLHVKTIAMDEHGNSMVLSDTAMLYKGSSTSGKGFEYNTSSPRFFSTHTCGGKSVFSMRGDIYLVSNRDTSVLVKYAGHFDPKFGSGYYQPQLDPSATYVVFRSLEPFLDFKTKPSLQKITLSTKKIEVLKTGVFANPVFSSDGKFILFSRDEAAGTSNTWKSSICYLELSTLKEKKIGEAYSAQWR